MRELRLVEPGRLRWQETAEPELDSPQAAIVRPIAVASCDLDNAIVAGRTPFVRPFPVGHEFVAEVVTTGPAVTSVRPGDRVSVPFQINCGACEHCRHGRTAHCTAAPGGAYGLGPLGGEREWGGAASDLVAVPYADAMCVPLPAGIDPAAAAGLSDNLVDGWRAVAPPLAAGGRAEHDRRVLVLGAGSIGLFATAVARALGAEVTYVDKRARNRAVAESLGATLAEPGQDRYPSHPVVAHTTTTPAGLRAAIASTASDGVCTDTGILYEDVALPMLAMYMKGITFVTGRVNARAIMPAALDLITSGKLDPAPVVATTVPWEEAPEAWAELRGRLVLTR